MRSVDLAVPSTNRPRRWLADGVAAPIAFCSTFGELESATPMALVLLGRAGGCDIPGFLPRELWRLLERVPVGEAVEWRPPTADGGLLGCTRYAVEGGGFLLLMQEVSEKRAALSQRLHRQRLESTGRLVASIAHEIRSSVASIVYSADVLDVGGAEVSTGTLRETLHEIGEASRRLQLTVDGLLDFARLGPAVCVPISLKEMLNRAQGLLRSYYRDGGHRLRVEIAPEATWVQGNPIVVEQVFVNLLLNAAECSEQPREVIIRSVVPEAEPTPPTHVHVLVSDDGPGIPEPLAERIFDPFFTTKANGTGLGLTNAREAAESQQGQLFLERSERGACFCVLLPAVEAPL